MIRRRFFGRSGSAVLGDKHNGEAEKKKRNKLLGMVNVFIPCIKIF